MATYTAYFGASNTIIPGWLKYNWLTPLVANTSGQALTQVDASNGIAYYTTSAPFVLPAYEYPTAIQITGYTNGRWWCGGDNYDSDSTGTVTVYLCFRSGSDAYETKQLGTISMSRNTASTAQYSWAVPSGQSLAGQELYLYITGTRALWFEGDGGYCTMQVTTASTYTACGAPSNVALSNASSGYSTLSWGAGTAGTNNAITSYQLQYTTSANGTTWGSAWTDAGTVNSGTLSTTVSAPSTSAVQYIKYRVRTVGAAGEAWASAYVESNSISTNTTAPTFTANITRGPSAGTPYLKGIHYFNASITGASASSPKTISTYSITSPFGGILSETTTYMASTYLNKAGTFTVTYAVTDSGGITTTKTKTITVYDYARPTIDIQFARCNTDQTDNVTGTAIKYKATATCTTANITNSIQSISLSINSRTCPITADNTWRLLYYTTSSESYDYSQPTNVKRDGTITVTDQYSSNYIPITIGSANFAIYLNDQGNAIAFGASTQYTDSVEVGDGRTLYVPTKIDAGTVEYDSLVASSSRTIKHDIKELGDFGNAIDALVPVTFVYDSDEKETKRTGLIYEDTIQVMPEICTPEGENKAISYIELVPILVKEIQNLRRRLNAVEGAMS